MGIPAYIYARFSTLEQQKGSSLERQLKSGREFVRSMGWDYSNERELTDEGKSAFHGDNRQPGSSLYEFERKAREGHFKDGAVLAVEALDRLTRQGHEEATSLIRGLTSNGVTVVTWFDNTIFPAGQKIDAYKQIGVIINAEQGHGESANKSKRLKSTWADRIAKVVSGEKKLLTRVVPGWLTVDATTETIVPDAGRVAILNQIYDWYLEGKGLPWIERELNQRGEPTWGLGRHSTNSKGWNVATLSKYLGTRTVLGEYEPKQRAGANAKVSKGVIVPNYYPQVIAPDKFNAVQALRITKRGWGKANQATFNNLFSGLATCFVCRGALHQTAIAQPGTQRRHPNKNGTFRTSTQKSVRSYLRCKHAARGYQCTNTRSYRYEPLEAGIVSTLAHWIRENAQFPPDSEVAILQTSVAEQERLIGIKQQELDQVIDNLTKVSSRQLAQKAADLEHEIDKRREEVERTREAYVRAMGATKPEEALDDLAVAFADLTSDDPEKRYEARARTHRSLHRVVKHMIGDPEGWIHVNVLNGLLVSFDPEGTPQSGSTMPGTVELGPNGEIDWHPDFPDADYEIHPSAL